MQLTGGNQIDINKRILCPKCGSEPVLKRGKYGNFYGCHNFSKCKYTKTLIYNGY